MLGKGEEIPVRNLIAFLAGRFAAKEAAIKALCGGFSFSSIEISRGSSGIPRLKYKGLALEKAVMSGARYNHLSISHERKFAVVMVILES